MTTARSHTPRSRQRRTRARRARLLRVVGGAIVALGALLIWQALTSPEQIQAVAAEVKGTVSRVVETVTEEPPSVALGISGDDADLDTCDGTFTEITRYAQADVPPVWAAHNKCGGDIILPWEVGQEFQIEGVHYTVTEVRYLPKRTATPGDLVGLHGELALQTCVYHQDGVTDMIKFVGAVRVDSSTETS